LVLAGLGPEWAIVLVLQLLLLRLVALTVLQLALPDLLPVLATLDTGPFADADHCFSPVLNI